jgi:hypothetical protein
MTAQSFPYTGEDDLPGIVELLNGCEAVDLLREGSSVEELRAELADSRACGKMPRAAWLGTRGSGSLSLRRCCW